MAWMGRNADIKNGTLCKLLKKARKQARDSQVLEAQVKELVITEEKVILEWGSEQESEYSEEDQLDDKEKYDKEGDGDDEGDDHISDTQDTNDEDDETESDGDEIYKYKIRVRKDEDVEMTNAEVEDFKKGNEEISNVAQADVKKTEEIKDTAKKAELPPTRSSLSVSLGFGDQFLKLSSNNSLVSIVKDNTDADINSLLEVKIQSEVPLIQSPSVLRVPVSVISKPTVLTPVQETSLVAPITTLPLPSVSTTPLVSQQTTTPIPSPPITTDAPIITSVVLESDALSVVQLRVAKLEMFVSELKKIDHSAKAFATLKSQVPTVVDNILDLKSLAPASSKIQTLIIYLKQESEKSASKILKIKKEQAEKQKMPKYTIKSTDKATLKEYDQKSALYQTMHKNKSFNRNPANHRLYYALMEALIEDENAMYKGVVDTVKGHKRKHDDDDDPPAGLNQGKAPSKGSKTGKSASTKEPVEEPIAEVVMDDVGENVVHGDDQPQDTSKPKTAKTSNPDCLGSTRWSLLQRILSHSTISRPLLLTSPNKLAWNNPEGDRYPFDMSKPLCLQGRPGHLTVSDDYFFNNDLGYLKSSDPERTYTTSITKTKAARYEIVGIEDMVPMLWSTIKHEYDKMLQKGSSIRVKGSVSVKKLHGYSHLEEVVVKRADRQLCKFKEGDFVDLHLNDIEDMLLLAVQHKIFHLNESDIVDFIVALCMFTRSLIIKRRVEDLQLCVESYKKKLNITPPQQTFPEIEFKELYTPSYKRPGVIYEDLVKQKRVMRADELYKFSNGTLKKVRDELHHRILDFRLGYNDEMSRRKWTAIDKKRSKLMVELIDKQMRERRIIINLSRVWLVVGKLGLDLLDDTSAV
ncbi:hypothetical protein Tco_0625225 [Tanacetum coccineum]|uniref:Uncharacterized protein n=1 Tax=Tanacetum coccineum TaxID=301880 RepID=A0ABQ4WG84_9ASTR